LAVLLCLSCSDGCFAAWESAKPVSAQMKHPRSQGTARGQLWTLLSLETQLRQSQSVLELRVLAAFRMQPSEVRVPTHVDISVLLKHRAPLTIKA
jgi:hypothetical protein